MDEPEENQEQPEENNEDIPLFGDFFGGSDDLINEREEESELQRKDLDEKEVQVMGVYEHHKQGSARPEAFVRLRDNQGRSVLIWIGQYEAYAIAVALEGQSSDRPLTHDLLKNVLDKVGGSVERILIDDLWNETYYAKITISLNGKIIEVDSRPSDAIALSLRAKAPIFIAESVLEQAAVYEEF